MKKVHIDHTVSEETTDRNGNPRWHVLLAKEILVSVCHSRAQAQDLANRLNIDPYCLERSQRIKGASLKVKV